MDETVAEFIKRTILKIPISEMMTVLKAWNFLPENQLQTINFRQRKESVIQHLLLLCEEKCASINDAALLDIVCTQVHRHKKIWDVFRMSKEPGDDVDLFDMNQFKSSFKKVLQRALKNALTIASKHHEIVKMDLRSRYLDSLKAIAFQQYNQVFEIHNSTLPLQERRLALDSRIIHENRVEKERVQRITQESFGDYPQPQLEFAQYKLETKFKSDVNGGILAERKEPLRCLIKFSSPHLLDALKSLAPAGIADAPLSPLLTCIPKKKMNYFKIRDK
ncbi:centromere protein N isoform X3 [Carlito syrichta]|uniref:Centromere protein N isoform X3 n=1 Tax=Carlito syrichta TaxID=1868482 RepID=A0A1U7TT38_CARSF|nr:centromere protein N isoform X3 [Carlito syrichta]